VPDHVQSPPPTPARPTPDSSFLRACRGRPGDRVPVWFMRQAGRSLPEYRALRGSGSILDAIQRPDLAAEITLQPVRRYGVDAAILYSDIVVPAFAIGFGVDVAPGTGPVVAEPFASARDLDRLRPLEAETDTAYVLETIRIVTKELPAGVPLIGFAGAPFTVASYLIEGAPSRTYGRTKAMMHGQPDLWHALADRLADLAVASLRSQIEAGAAAIQLFDSWAGALSPPDYERFVLPHSAKVFAGVADLGVPRIHFGVGTGELLALMRDAGADVVGVDWRVPLDVARTRLGGGVALQGNLDPAVCLAPWPVVEAQALDVLARNAGHPGHIFNLGHGVLPELDPGILAQVVDLVHERGRADG
jgi:uroporphyrinogen decarboxylase